MSCFFDFILLEFLNALIVFSKLLRYLLDYFSLFSNNLWKTNEHPIVQNGQLRCYFEIIALPIETNTDIDIKELLLKQKNLL